MKTLEQTRIEYVLKLAKQKGIDTKTAKKLSKAIHAVPSSADSMLCSILEAIEYTAKSQQEGLTPEQYLEAHLQDKDPKAPNERAALAYRYEDILKAIKKLTKNEKKTLDKCQQIAYTKV